MFIYYLPGVTLKKTMRGVRPSAHGDAGNAGDTAQSREEPASHYSKTKTSWHLWAGHKK